MMTTMTNNGFDKLCRSLSMSGPEATSLRKLIARHGFTIDAYMETPDIRRETKALLVQMRALDEECQEIRDGVVH